MNKLARILTAVACALPLVAAAQTSTPSSMDTAPSPNIKPADATTSGKNTGNDNAGNSMSRSSTKPKDTTTSSDKTKQAAPAGSVPTYPAPAPDGTPTSPSTTK